MPSDAFWLRVASHPEVRKTLYGNEPFAVLAKVRDPSVKPFASRNGAWLFIQQDPCGLIYDLHAMFTPEGWGKEVHATLIQGLEALPWQLVFCFETDNPRSRPPLSFGFRPSSDPTPTEHGDLTVWTLTRNAWEVSPAFRRMKG